MLNYVSAECWKLRRRKGLWVGLALLLALESLIFAPWFWYPDALPYRRESLYALLAALLFLGLFLVPIFAVLAFDDQHGHGTLKNEIVYGVPRARIYLGKLLTAALAGTLAAVAAVGWYLLLTWLLGAPDPTGGVTLTALLAILAANYLVWLSELSLTFLLLMSVKSAAGAVAAACFVTIFGSFFALIGVTEDAALGWRLAVDLFFTAPLRGMFTFDGAVGPTVFPFSATHPLLYALAVSALWVGAATALGLVMFRRREIK